MDSTSSSGPALPTSFGILFHPCLLLLVLSTFLSLPIPSASQCGLPSARISSSNHPFSFYSSAGSVICASTLPLKPPSVKVASDCLTVKSKGMFFISPLCSSHCIPWYFSTFLPWSCAQDLPLPILSLFTFCRVLLLALILQSSPSIQVPSVASPTNIISATFCVTITYMPLCFA